MLQDIGPRLSWGAFRSFLQQLDLDSATARSLNPDMSKWAGRLKTNEILADIFDVLSMINANLVAIGQRKRAKTPDRYPRPGVEQPGRQQIGKGPLPPDELRAWFEKKRRERNG